MVKLTYWLITHLFIPEDRINKDNIIKADGLTLVGHIAITKGSSHTNETLKRRRSAEIARYAHSAPPSL